MEKGRKLQRRAICLLAHLLLAAVGLPGCQPQRQPGPGQAKQLASQQMYQNVTLVRPLERPSLTLVGKPQQVARNRSELAPAEGAADWFMLGGGAGAADLTPEEAKGVASFSEEPSVGGRAGGSRKRAAEAKRRPSSRSNRTAAAVFDDEQFESSDSSEVFDEAEEGSSGLAGSQKEPECGAHGRYYCTYKEEYPLKLVTEVTKYYKWPLEKLFRDLHAQIMPKLAQDSSGSLVCDSITRVVRPGWARNTNERWLVVINTENYHQYVTEVVCQYGSNSRCNFIPPCYYSSCQQRYNTQKLLVIDPNNPYRGPFLSEFLFPSCCVCYVPSSSDSFQDKYRSSPATIYQRTIQQESNSNLSPPQFRPSALVEDPPGHLADGSSVSPSGAHSAPNAAAGKPTNMAAGPGEIRRAGDQYQGRQADQQHQLANELADFPRLGLADSMVSPKQPEVRQRK